MSLQRVLEQAQKIAARSRLRLVRPLAAAVVGTALGVYMVVSRPLSTIAISILIIILTMLWVPTGRKIYAAFQVHRWVWPGQLRPGLALNSSLEFYRAELDRQHRSYSHMARPWLMVVVGVAFGLPIVWRSVSRGSSIQDVAPFVILMVAWVVVSWYARNRQARQIEREISELNDFEREI